MVHKSKHLTKKETEMTGGEALIRTLIDLGVEVVFGYPGGAILPTYDAFCRFSDCLYYRPGG
jgi:acetolactate synthase-1/2/3 large subunit